MHYLESIAKFEKAIITNCTWENFFFFSSFSFFFLYFFGSMKICIFVDLKFWRGA